ncbi:MAG: transposase [Ktedonobacterales bacterium]
MLSTTIYQPSIPEIEECAHELEALHARMGPHFERAEPRRRALADRELYLSEEWATDRARRAEGGVPEDVEFATKSELSRRMLVRLRSTGLLPAWVTGDTVYGGSPTFCAWLEEQHQPYVLAIAANDGVDLTYGDMTMHVLPVEIAQYALDPPDWCRLSVGAGAPRCAQRCGL